MKLLSPLEAQKRTRSDDALRAVRSKELYDAVNDKSVELATLEADFQKLLASQRARWALEEQEHAARASEMRQEIEILEKNRAYALIPIEAREKEAHNKVQEADVILMRANEKERHNDGLTGILEKRLDDLAEREAVAVARKLTLDRREQGIAMQEAQTATHAKNVSEAAEAVWTDIKTRKEALADFANELQTKQFALESRTEALAAKELELQASEANLQSRYLALAEAENYIHSKK